MRVHHGNVGTHADKVVGVAEASVEDSFEYRRLARALGQKHRHRRLQVGREAGILVRAHRHAFKQSRASLYTYIVCPHLKCNASASQEHEQSIDVERFAIGNFYFLTSKRSEQDKTARLYAVGRSNVRQTAAVQEFASGAFYNQSRRVRT